MEDFEELKKYLTIVNYPAKKEDIFKVVEKEGANMNIITMIQLLPSLTFHTPKEVTRSIGLDNESRVVQI